MENKKFLECGRIINTHGVKGAVKLESWCNDPETLAALGRLFIQKGEGMECLTVKHASVFKQFVIAEIEEIPDIETAILLKNTIVYAAREDFDLEEGDYFIADLVGLPVVDAVNGHRYGVLQDVINRGASDIYVVNTPDGERMMPVVPEFVKQIEPNTAIYIAPIPGMFD